MGVLTAALAQSPRSRKRSKIKDFGSSVKRLKWDPRKNSAVEINRSDKKLNDSDPDDVIRVDTTLITSDVLVLDKHGRAVQGLTAADFTVHEDDAPQQVGHFLLGDNVSVPRTIVLIIDYSGSQVPYLADSIEAAKVLVDKLGPLDQMAIVTDDVELLLDFTDDKKKLKKKLDSLIDRAQGGSGFLGFGGNQRFGKSEQYSALFATLNEMFDEQDLRPIVVFQTDGDELSLLRNPVIVPYVAPGLPIDLLEEDERYLQRRRQFIQDNIREFSLDDVYREVEKSHATIYTVIPGFRLMGLTPEEQVAQLRAEDYRRMDAWARSLPERLRKEFKARIDDRWRRTPPQAMKFRAAEETKVQSALAGVSSLTGGWTEFLEQPSQAHEIYSKIFSDINQRYIVGYYPTNKERDGKRRKISIEVSGHPDYTILGRKSYFAPAQ
jgi:VWFA-related protein